MVNQLTAVLLLIAYAIAVLILTIVLAPFVIWDEVKSWWDRTELSPAACIGIAVGVSFFAGWSLSPAWKPSHHHEWQPKVGERVRSFYSEGEFGKKGFVTVVTNVVFVGSRSQTGLLVYGPGLPGVDSWWVTPAP